MKCGGEHVVDEETDDLIPVMFEPYTLVFIFLFLRATHGILGAGAVMSFSGSLGDLGSIATWESSIGIYPYRRIPSLVIDYGTFPEFAFVGQQSEWIWLLGSIGLMVPAV